LGKLKVGDTTKSNAATGASDLEEARLAPVRRINFSASMSPDGQAPMVCVQKTATVTASNTWLKRSGSVNCVAATRLKLPGFSSRK
jgi:hypothetical protein